MQRIGVEGLRRNEALEICFQPPSPPVSELNSPFPGPETRVLLGFKGFRG